MSDLRMNESEIITAIERLEQEMRAVMRRIEHASSEADKRVLNRQLQEAMAQISSLRQRMDR